MENQREIYKEEFAEYLLCLAMDVGEAMLKNGAEIARIEDTIERICKAYGAIHVECFSIISMIIASIRMPDGSGSSQMRRVRQTANNLDRLESFNALSRRICLETPELSVFDEMIHELKRKKAYPTWLLILASAFGTAFFCLFFDGGAIDALITFFVGAAVSAFMNIPSARLNLMAKTVISAFITATLAGLCAMLIPNLNVDSIIIGTIMLLVPGMMFGNAVRDLLIGDLLAGMLKLLQSIIQTLMICFGYMLAYQLIGGALVPEFSMGEANPVAVKLISATLATVAFAIAFKANKRHLAISGLCGLLTLATYYIIELSLSSLFWAAFISSAVAALYCEIAARIRKTPAIIFLMPGIFSTVPGGYLYRAARDFTRGLNTQALNHLGNAAAIAIGIAGGIVTVSILFGIIGDYFKKHKKERG